jgi:hypothetical protein
LQGRSLHDPSVGQEFDGKLLSMVKVVRSKRCTTGCKNIEGVVACGK